MSRGNWSRRSTRCNWCDLCVYVGTRAPPAVSVTPIQGNNLDDVLEISLLTLGPGRGNATEETNLSGRVTPVPLEDHYGSDSRVGPKVQEGLVMGSSLPNDQDLQPAVADEISASNPEIIPEGENENAGGSAVETSANLGRRLGADIMNDFEMHRQGSLVNTRALLASAFYVFIGTSYMVLLIPLWSPCCLLLLMRDSGLESCVCNF
jgi:hypothetical protein